MLLNFEKEKWFIEALFNYEFGPVTYFYGAIKLRKDGTNVNVQICQIVVVITFSTAEERTFERKRVREMDLNYIKWHFYTFSIYNILYTAPSTHRD